MSEVNGSIRARRHLPLVPHDTMTPRGQTPSAPGHPGAWSRDHGGLWGFNARHAPQPRHRQTTWPLCTHEPITLNRVQLYTPEHTHRVTSAIMQGCTVDMLRLGQSESIQGLKQLFPLMFIELLIEYTVLLMIGLDNNSIWPFIIYLSWWIMILCSLGTQFCCLRP